MVYLIYTDGACEPNPGIGGWGFSITNPSGELEERCGGQLETTNNRMEMTAILFAMQAVPTGAKARIHSDSQYCVNGLTVWRPGWKKKNWMKKEAPMPNRDLWMDLEKELTRIKAELVWVRGHNGDPGNERADQLANIGRMKVIA